MADIVAFFCKFSLRWMPQDLIVDGLMPSYQLLSAPIPDQVRWHHIVWSETNELKLEMSLFCH